jgi:hypothetical protein
MRLNIGISNRCPVFTFPCTKYLKHPAQAQWASTACKTSGQVHNRAAKRNFRLLYHGGRVPLTRYHGNGRRGGEDWQLTPEDGSWADFVWEWKCVIASVCVTPSLRRYNSASMKFCVNSGGCQYLEYKVPNGRIIAELVRICNEAILAEMWSYPDISPQGLKKTMKTSALSVCWPIIEPSNSRIRF